MPKHYFPKMTFILMFGLFFLFHLSAYAQTNLGKYAPGFTAKHSKSEKQLPDQADQEWYQQATNYISQQEYFFKNVSHNNKIFTVNRKQGTGYLFDGVNMRISPLQTSAVTHDSEDWTVDLRLSSIGKSNTNFLDQSGIMQMHGNENHLEVIHPDFKVQYENDSRGLRQNFIVQKRPESSGLLQVNLQMMSNLKAEAEENGIRFLDKKGKIKLFYRDLHVWDANGKVLPATIAFNSKSEISIKVDDNNAMYPITIDPITQTPEWTTSADGILPSLIGSLAVESAYGYSVAYLGDVNGDGFDDVGVGAPTMADVINGSGSIASMGAVFVYFGSSNGLPTTPSAKLQPTTLVGGALFGYSLASGDVTGDGRSDLIVGAPMDNVTITVGGGSTATGKVGKVYVFNGATLATSTTPLFTLQLSGAGILENGVNLSVKALFGFSVAVTEDLNNDGKRDMIVGAPTYAGVKSDLLGNVADVQSGGAFVFLTSGSGTGTTLVKLQPFQQDLLGLNILNSNIKGLLFGYAVDGMGDYNGDGRPDVVATAPAGIDAGSLSSLLFGKVLQGSALIYYGTGSTVNTTIGAKLTATSGGLLDNLVGSLKNVANLFGVSVRGLKTAAGARNGAVMVGAPLGGALVNVVGLNLKAGTVSIFKKKGSSPAGYVAPDQVISSPRNSNTILGIIQANVLFGYSLDNTFDLNCDGINDIVVGEPVSSGVQLINANVAGGAAYIYFGKADGSFKSTPVWTLTAYEDAFLGVNTTSLIGYSVAGVGKVKGVANNNRVLVGSPSRTLDFGSGLLNLGGTVSTLFSLVAGDNGVGKAFAFDTKLCVKLSLQSTSPNCSGTATGTITATFTEGVGPYTIKLDGGSYVAATSPYTFTGVSAGAHTVYVMDANGTETSQNITVTDPPAITATVSVVNPLCPGQANGSFTITASGGTGTLTYSKDNGATYQTSSSFTGLAAGTYNWLVKDANGCTKSGTATLVDPTPVSATATGTNPSFFGGSDGSFSITASGGTGTLTYSKDGGTTFQSSNTFTGLTCTTFNWVVRDANGCTKAGTITLVCPPDITVSVTKADPTCFGATGSFTLTASGGTGTLTYSKDGGTTYQQSGSFTGLTAGTYNWKVKDANGFSKSGMVTLINPPAINASSTVVNPLCNGGTGSFTITASGGTGTLSYSKDNGATYQASNSFTGLVAGTYNWVVKDANGCTKTGTATIVNPAAITASVSFTNPSGAGTSDGSFTIAASGGTGTLMYSKDGGATFQASNSFTGLTCATYNWVVKDANGCTKSGTVTLTCPPAITVTVTKVDPNCFGAATGSFTLTANGGVGTLSYSKDGGTTFQTSNTFTSLIAGTYNWVVKDANGITKSGTITLTNPPAITANATPTNPLCYGGTSSFTISASGGTGTLTYSKDGGTTFQSSNSSTGLVAGTYNWVVKDANGCTKTGTVTITNPAAITASATFTNPTYFGATNGSFTITATGGTGTLAYSKDGGITYQASNSFTGLACGTYNWVVRDANGCTKGGTVNLVCAADITVSVTKTDPKCYGSSDGSFTLTASGGTGALTYSKDGGTTFQSSNSFTGLVEGTYNWVVKDANGYTKTGTVTLTNPAAITAIATPSNPLCNGGAGSFTITASGGTGTLTYSKDNGVTYQTSSSFTILTAGTYNWVVKDASGCTKSGTVTITNPTAITASVTFTNPSGAGTTDGSFTITASGGTGTLMYSKDGGTTFQASGSFTGLTCGTYNWVVKDANGCLKSGTVTLTCPAAITVTVTQTNPACYGAATGSFTLTASGGVSPYSYSKDGGTTFQTSATFTGLVAGTYNYVVKDANGATKSGTVTLTNPAAITANATSNNPLCNGGTGSFTITASGGTGTLTYSKDGGTTYQTSNSFTGLVAGTYNWVVKDANGCTKSGTATLVDPTPVSATATGTNPSFFGGSDGSFSITASGGTGTLTYSKDGGSTFQSSNTFTGLTCTTFNWVVKDANGCTKAGTITLVCPPDITVSVTKADPTCFGATGSFTITASGGTGTLTYSKDGGVTYQASGSFTGLTAGTYNWKVKDANGFSKSGMVTLINPPAINASSTVVNPLCNGGTGSLTITASGGTGTLTYSKDGGTTYQASNSFTGLIAGTYNWVVKDANGCTKTGTAVIVNPAAITASVSFTNPTSSGGSDGSFTIAASGGTGTLMYSKDGGTTFQASNSFTGLTCGTYNWVVKDANGCTKSGTVTLTCPPPVGAHIFPTSTTCNTYQSGAQPLSQLCYTSKNGLVSNVTPGVFFYYSYITAPSSSFCIDIVQSNNSGFANYMISQSQVFLFDLNCTKVATGTEVSAGLGRICVTNAVVGTKYVLSVKYDSKSVIGSNSSASPNGVYSFESRINGLTVSNSAGTITMYPNNCANLTTTRPGMESQVALTDVPVTLEAKVSPNPTQDFFKLHITGISNEPVQIRVIDVAGRITASQTTSTGYIELGRSWKHGMYFIEVRQKEKRIILKVEKL